LQPADQTTDFFPRLFQWTLRNTSTQLPQMIVRHICFTAAKSRFEGWALQEAVEAWVLQPKHDFSECNDAHWDAPFSFQIVPPNGA